MCVWLSVHSKFFLFFQPIVGFVQIITIESCGCFMCAANLLEYITEATQRWTFQAIENATVSVDSFFVLRCARRAGCLCHAIVTESTVTVETPLVEFFSHYQSVLHRLDITTLVDWA